MVQIQSSWFPLYDRNPQTFVPNIFWAKPGDYKKATQRVSIHPIKQALLSCRWWRCGELAR
jgi:predicted acyl esterase